jgi:hypothetical protein
MAGMRKETDSLGAVEVPADKLWGAQTQRSLQHFSIGKDLIPREMITAYAILKKGAAIANHAGKRLDDKRYKLIVQVCDEIQVMQGTRTTIYASSSDLALRASTVVHGFRRVGETVGGVFVYPGVDTIDASGVVTMIREYGHSYLMDSASVLKDVRTIIQQKIAAKQRGLPEMGKAPDFYWQCDNSPMPLTARSTLRRSRMTKSYYFPGAVTRPCGCERQKLES